MDDVTEILERIETGDACAANQLLALVHDQLRRLASGRMKREAPGQSWQTTDLVHEAYLRLVGTDQKWKSREYFFATAAEAMRRILVERARKKRRIKHGGLHTRVELQDTVASKGPSPDEVVMVSDLLDSLAAKHPLEARIVKLHYFAGLSISAAGKVLGVSSSTAHRHWIYARAWLHEATCGKPSDECENANGELRPKPK